MSDICQDSHFINSVLFVLMWLCANLYLFKGILLTIFYPFYQIDTWIGAISKFLENREVTQLCTPFILHLIRMTKMLACFLLRRWRYIYSVTDNICRALFTVSVRINVLYYLWLLRRCINYGAHLKLVSIVAFNTLACYVDDNGRWWSLLLNGDLSLVLAMRNGLL